MLQDIKNQFIPSDHPSNTVNLRVPRPDSPHPFLTVPTSKNFDQLLVYVNLHKHEKIRLFQWFVLDPFCYCQGSKKYAPTHTERGINSENQQFAEELHRPIIRKLKKCYVYSSFRDNTSGGDLADIRLINKYNNEIQLLLSCVIDIFSKYA